MLYLLQILKFGQGMVEWLISTPHDVGWDSLTRAGRSKMASLTWLGPPLGWLGQLGGCLGSLSLYSLSSSRASL